MSGSYPTLEWRHLESGGMCKLEVCFINGGLYFDIERDDGWEVSGGSIRLTMDKAKEFQAWLNSALP